MTAPQHIPGITTHARRGEIRNAFRYGVDYVLLEPEDRTGPALFSRNRWNLLCVRDRNHGGKRGAGLGADWAHSQLQAAGLSDPYRLFLLTQATFLGFTFNPVSFWLAFAGDDLLAVIAEVNNTFGDRHNYLCHLPGFAPMTGQTPVEVHKVFHVSPFQAIAGDYKFTFDITPQHIAIRIVHKDGPQGLVATLCGPRRPLTNASILSAALRRPAGAMRTVALIYWQALRLKLKGARYRTRPLPPTSETTKCDSSPDA